MRIRTQAAVTFTMTAVAIGALSVWGVSETPVAVAVDDTAVLVPAHDGVYLPTWEGVDVASHCVATVDEGLDWYEEGPHNVPAAEESILYDACHYFGRTAEAQIWPDGSWVVEETQGVDRGIWWQGCFSVGTCMD